MALQKIDDIEGLSGYEDHELLDDTPVNDMLVRFDVVAEEMPFLTEQNPDGTIVYKNFVYIFKEKHVGNFQMRRRLRDTVEWNAEQGVWEIKKLHRSLSDIRLYPKEWNLFFRSAKEGGEIGMPISILFRNDPARVAKYKYHKISTVERLAALPESDAETLGMGAVDDVKRARKYLEFSKEKAPAMQVQSQIDDLRALIQDKDAVIQDLTVKLTQVLESQLASAKVTEKSEEAPRRRGRPSTKGVKYESDKNIEGILK